LANKDISGAGPGSTVHILPVGFTASLKPVLQQCGSAGSTFLYIRTPAWDLLAALKRQSETKFMFEKIYNEYL
jgi:hypothetical protein